MSSLDIVRALTDYIELKEITMNEAWPVDRRHRKGLLKFLADLQRHEVINQDESLKVIHGLAWTMAPMDHSVLMIKHGKEIARMFNFTSGFTPMKAAVHDYGVVVSNLLKLSFEGTLILGGQITKKIISYFFKVNFVRKLVLFLQK